MSGSAAVVGQTTCKRRRHFVFIGGTSEPGGLHFHTADVARACAALGTRVTILCTSINYFEPLFDNDGIAVEVLPQLEKLDRRAWISTFARFATSSVRPDFVFCLGMAAEAPIADLAAAAAFGGGVYVIVHRPFEGSWNSPLSKVGYGRLSSLFVSRNIAVSEEIAAKLIGDFRIPKRKVTTCLNWADPMFRVPTAAERAAARQALGFPPSTTIVGYLGRLAPEKRIDALIDAFAEVGMVGDTPLALALLGDGWKRAELMEKTKALGIAHRVHFLGWTSTPWSALAACNIFVLPSLVEGFPLALMEAMASGCACLAHPMPSSLRLIANGRDGVLADLSDRQSFANALRGLIAAGPSATAALGRSAADRIAEEFSRAERLPAILAALDLGAIPAPEFHSRRLQFKAL